MNKNQKNHQLGNHRILYRLAKIIMTKWMKRHFQIKIENEQILSQLQPPYILLANHTSFWDPFFLGLIFKEHISFVTSDAAFRSPIINALLAITSAIPKTKGKSDLDAIKYIINIKKQGGVIGIFPEGRRTWDGNSLPVIPSTAKLIKMLKVPVIAARFKGSYTLNPRWGFKANKGPITIELVPLFFDTDWKNLKSEKILEEIDTALKFSEREYLKENPIIIQEDSRAEGIERVLYTCTNCNTIGKLHSKKDYLECGHCGMKFYYQKDGSFKGETTEPLCRSIAEWNNWQQEKLATLIKNTSPHAILFADKNTLLYTGFKSKKPQLYGKGVLSFSRKALHFDSGKATSLTFPLEEITAVNVQNSEFFEFYWNKKMYSFNNKKRRFSGYKWLSAYELSVESTTETG